MISALTLGEVAVGVILLIAAALAGRLFGNSMRSMAGGLARAAIGVAGAALLIWALLPYLGAHTQPAKAADVSPPPAPAPVDLVQVAGSALHDCAIATAPSVPDGNTASLEQMRTAQAAFKAFDSATNAYSNCVDTAIDHIAQQVSGTAAPADVEALRLFGTRAHNTAIDQEQAVVDQFNVQVRTYKAKHAKS